MDTKRQNEATVEQQVAIYQVSKEAALRGRIVERNVALVQAVAKTIARRCGFLGILTFDDLVGFGMFGLFAAIESFDAGRGLKLTTHASPRIRGAMMDALREQDFTPRLERARGNAIDALRKELGRDPTWGEVDRRLDGERVHKPATPVSAFRIAKVVPLASLPLLETENGRCKQESHFLFDRKSRVSIDQIDARDEVDRLLACLRPKERLMMKLYYIEDLTLKQIGNALGISESRVSQVASNVLARLRAKFADGVAA